MTSINKKKIALIEKYNQEKLRNQAMKMGVTLKTPETVFFIKRYQVWQKCYYSSIRCNWKKS